MRIIQKIAEFQPKWPVYRYKVAYDVNFPYNIKYLDIIRLLAYGKNETIATISKDSEKFLFFSYLSYLKELHDRPVDPEDSACKWWVNSLEEEKDLVRVMLTLDDLPRKTFWI
jgi:hypothetical protein